MGHLNKLLEKYENKGFRIVSVSSESAATIESVMVKQLGGKFWMASDPGRDTIAPFGGGGIPHAYLVDAMGKVVWNGHPGNLKDEQIEKLLAQAYNPALERELHKSLTGHVKAYRKGQYGKAFTGAGKYAEDESRTLKDDALYLRERCEAAAAFKRKVIETSIEGKDYETAYDLLKTLPKDFAGMQIADWAKDTQAKLDADEAVKNERKAWKAFTKARAKEQKAGSKAKKLAPVAKSYLKVVKKYPGTRAAEMAEKSAGRVNKLIARLSRR